MVAYAKWGNDLAFPWSSLVDKDEQPDWHNSQRYLEYGYAWSRSLFYIVYTLY